MHSISHIVDNTYSRLLIYSSMKNYRPDIDGLRATAVLAVVAYHAAPGRMPGGFIGVDIFFVISGYLISSILLNSLDNGKFSVVEFYERRIRRIFPALFVVLLACTITGWFFLLPSEYQQLGKHTIAGTAFVSNFALWSESGYFDNAADFKILLHLWSLGIEEQFYIFWPIILWFAYKRNWKLSIVIGLIALGSFVLNIYLSNTNPASAFFLPLPRFWELAAGALLAAMPKLIVRSTHSPLAHLAPHIASIVGVLLLLAGFYFINKQSVFPGWWALLPVSGAALLIAAGPQSVFNRWVLSNRVMIWFGLISYPLYLWHWPILSFLRTMEGQEIQQSTRIVAVVAAIILAWLTYRFVEIPVRRSAKKNSTVWSLLTLLAAMGLFGVSAYLSDGFKNRSGNLPKVVNAGDVGHTEFFGYITGKFHPCTPESIRAKITPELGVVRCFQSKPDDVKTMALIGDSHAEHLFIGLAEALPSENLVFYPTGGLPFTSNKELVDTFSYVLGNPRIMRVILSASWAGKLSDPGRTGWKADLAATVAELNAAGKSVFITDDVPEFPFLPSRCKFSGRPGIDNICLTRNAQANMEFLPGFDAIAEGNPRVTIIRAYDLFCKPNQCAMAYNGTLYFRDQNHLNIAGSKKVGSAIAQVMKEKATVDE